MKPTRAGGAQPTATIRSVAAAFIFFAASALSTMLLSVRSAAAAAAEPLAGQVVAVLDGDTVILLDEKHQQHRLRLAQIDAPELGHGTKAPGQPFGQQSKRSLAALVHGRKVRADCDKIDRYQRRVCTVRVGKTGGDVDVGLEQVRRGMAWVFPKYAREAEYFQAERDARAVRRGLWADENPTPPWDWRRRRRALHTAAR